MKIASMIGALAIGSAALAAFAGLPGTAAAEVRIGKNVRIGGNPVVPQTFTAKRRGLYVIHEGKPPNPGCTWRANADGSRTKICHLQRRNP